METKQKRTVIVMAVALAGLLTALTLVMADDSKSNAPPHLLIQTLQEIREVIVSSTSESEEKIGYCQYFEVASQSSEVAFTVPEGKRFVLLKLYCTQPTINWSLTVNDNLFIDGSINKFRFESIRCSCDRNHYQYVHDFPDGCVVVDADQTLNIVFDDTAGFLKMTIIGYFYDVE